MVKMLVISIKHRSQSPLIDIANKKLKYWKYVNALCLHTIAVKLSHRDKKFATCYFSFKSYIPISMILIFIDFRKQSLYVIFGMKQIIARI